MKKYVALLIVALCAFGVWGASLGTLSPEAKQEYYRKSLSIEVGSQTTNSFSGGTTRVSPYSAVSYGTATSTTGDIWTPYQGATPISKYDFLNLVGETNLAEQLMQQDKEREKNFRNMWICYGLGMAIALAGDISLVATASDPNWILVSVLNGIGLGVIFVGIPFEMKLDNGQSISIKFVLGLADAYNEKLLSTF